VVDIDTGPPEAIVGDQPGKQQFLGVPLAIVAEALGHLAPSHVAETIRAKLPSFGVEIAGNVRKLRP
jgi:hypothetical protein